jgi:hypothetical protein
MLVLKCAACKKKLWRYDKIGPGGVLRCHKDRIIRMYVSIMEDNKLNAPVERISVRRIVSYDGQRLKYWYNDHKSGKRKMDDITVLENIAFVK